MLGIRRQKTCGWLELGLVPLMLMGCTGSLRMSAGTAAAAGRAPAVMCAPPTARFQVDTLDWDAAARQRFEALAHRQSVVVRVADCGWTILDGCTARATYEYRSLPLQRERSDGNSNSGITFGSTAATPSVARSSTRVRDVAVAGVFELPASPSSLSLHGACEGATHVVVRYTTGAFSVSDHASRTGGVHIPYAGSAETADQQTYARQAGDPATCAQRSETGLPSPDCNASIQLDLEPIAPQYAPTMAEPSPQNFPRAPHAPQVTHFEPCARGDVAMCRQQCMTGTPSSCSALVILCASGSSSACAASAQIPLNSWSAWVAATR